MATPAKPAITQLNPISSDLIEGIDGVAIMKIFSGEYSEETRGNVDVTVFDNIISENLGAIEL